MRSRENKLGTIIHCIKKSAALASQPTEETFPELPEVLIWIRFALATVYGAFLGHKGIRGGIMVMQTLNLVVFVPVLYCRLYLGCPPGAFSTQIIFSGTPNALALALLIWIYCFTAQHADEEAKLAVFLVAGLEDTNGVVMDEEIPQEEQVNSEF